MASSRQNTRIFSRHTTALDRRMFRLERKYRALFYKELQRQKEELIKTGSFTSKFEDIYLKLYKEDGYQIIVNQYKLLKGLQTTKDNFFSTTWRVWLDTFIATRMGQKIVAIDNTTRTAVQNLISRNVGNSFEDIADQMTMFDRKRAMRIARTEVAQMANESQKRGMLSWKDELTDVMQEGIPVAYKMWMHRGAKDPRDGHLNLHGTTIREDELFQIVSEHGVEQADYPHAEGLSASNVVNCGCTAVYVSENYYRQRLKN